MSAVAEGFGFRVAAGPAPPQEWRPLDRAVSRWVTAHGGGPLLARVAGWASYAEGRGDSALLLAGAEAGRHGMPPLDDAALRELAREPLVEVAGVPAEGSDAAFVLDGTAFYLRRNHRHEQAVAAGLAVRRQHVPASDGVTDADLRALFNGSWSEAEAPQRAAVRQALGRRLFVLTGGPGTGKTTTVLRMLLAMARAHGSRHAGQPPTIRIAAPTGKAAQRLSDALRQGALRMRQPPGNAAGWQTLGDAWEPWLAAVLAYDAGTLHRLLGSRGGHGGFVHHAGNPLPADIVVVDEASMVDLAMMRALLDALRPEAALVLVGDADQLTSVGTGSVLLDIVQALERTGAGDLVRLRHCFRADTALARLNAAVRSGDVHAFAEAWGAAAAAGKAERHDLPARPQLRRRLVRWGRTLAEGLAGSGAFAEVAAGDAAAVRRCLAAVRSQQLLCALRAGEFGAMDANDTLEETILSDPRLGDWQGTRWYPGRAVMVTRNDPASGLFNGDVGVCLLTRGADAAPQLQVWFEGAGDAPDSLRCFATNALPPHQGAFALTMHKSQGSEYDTVAVLLPPEDSSRVLSRQLLYTGLSRARGRVELWSTEAALARALECEVGRVTGLSERL